GNGSAVSTVAVCRAMSSRTSRTNCFMTPKWSRFLDRVSRRTAPRARPASSKPLTRQRRNTCLARRLGRRVRVIAGPLKWPSGGKLPGRFLGQSVLIVRRQDLAGHRRHRPHDQLAHLVFEFGEHAVVVLLGGLAGFVQDLFGGGMGFLRLLL